MFSVRYLLIRYVHITGLYQVGRWSIIILYLILSDRSLYCHFISQECSKTCLGRSWLMVCYSHLHPNLHLHPNPHLQLIATTTTHQILFRALFMIIRRTVLFQYRGGRWQFVIRDCCCSSNSPPLILRRHYHHHFVLLLYFPTFLSTFIPLIWVIRPIKWSISDLLVCDLGWRKLFWWFVADYRGRLLYWFLN